MGTYEIIDGTAVITYDPAYVTEKRPKFAYTVTGISDDGQTLYVNAHNVQINKHFDKEWTRKY